LTDERWPDALPTLRCTPRDGEVEQSMTEARQTISMIITFRSSSKMSLDRRNVANLSRRKETPNALVLCSIMSCCFDCHSKLRRNRVELGYIAMKGTEYFVWLLTKVVITEEYNVMIDSEELNGTTECLTL
jgi:hypothetical protein